MMQKMIDEVFVELANRKHKLEELAFGSIRITKGRSSIIIEGNDFHIIILFYNFSGRVALIKYSDSEYTAELSGHHREYLSIKTWNMLMKFQMRGSIEDEEFQIPMTVRECVEAIEKIIKDRVKYFMELFKEYIDSEIEYYKTYVSD